MECFSFQEKTFPSLKTKNPSLRFYLLHPPFTSSFEKELGKIQISIITSSQNNGKMFFIEIQLCFKMFFFN